MNTPAPINQQGTAKTHHSVYPLDKSSRLISESVDSNGYTHKWKRFFSDSGEFVDVEIVIKNNAEQNERKEEVLPVDSSRRIVAQEEDVDGYIHKLMLVEQNGEIQEYYITEKIPL